MTPVSPAPARHRAASAWDHLVDASPAGTFYQLEAWVTIKAATGWSATRWPPEDNASSPGLAAHVLLARRRPLPWAFAYGPRAPFGAELGPAAVERFTAALRGALRGQRVAVIRIDPEIEAGGPLDPGGGFVRALETAGWRPAAPVQRPDTWLLDLRPDEAQLWRDVRPKWKQYVNRGRAHGVVVREAGREGLPNFHRLLVGTADRLGFVARPLSTFDRMWDAFAVDDRVSLLFAVSTAGEPIAALFLVRCGGRISEPWGGSASLAGELHANHLLKWESIVRARAAGALEYDMCGLVNPGITNFKSGFGGRAVRYIGAWDLVLDRLGAAAWRAGRAASVVAARLGRRAAATGAEGDA